MLASYAATQQSVDIKQGLRKDKILAAEQFRFVMRTAMSVPSLADPRDQNEHAIRCWLGDGLRPSKGALPCSVRRREKVVLVSEIVLLP